MLSCSAALPAPLAILAASRPGEENVSRATSQLNSAVTFLPPGRNAYGAAWMEQVNQFDGKVCPLITAARYD